MQLAIPPPNPKQAMFFRSRARFTAFGGSRGGGKSWAVRQKAKLLAVKYAGIRILILRRTYPDLQDNHITPLCADCKGIASYSDKYRKLSFFNGSFIRFGYFASESDELQYQGQEFDVIFIDEATQFAEIVFETLKACIRGVNSFPKRIYLTCNPGGVGHAWVKRLFIDREFKPTEDPDDYAFIQSKVYDNKTLLDSDPDYIKMLESQPPGRREAWLDGRWDVYEGQYFTGWNPDVNVITPFEIPDWWRIYRTIDYGLDMLACLWVAVDADSNAYVIKELHEPDLIVSEAAKRIIEYSEGMTIYDTLAPPDLWARTKDSGIMTADLFRDAGVQLRKVSSARVFGWQCLAEYIKPVKDVDGGTTSRLKVFSNCRTLIKNLPLLQRDDKNPDDCSTEPHAITHICDAIRIYCSTYPVEAKEPDTRAPGVKFVQDYKKRAIGSKKDRRRARF